MDAICSGRTEFVVDKVCCGYFMCRTHTPHPLLISTRCVLYKFVTNVPLCAQLLAYLFLWVISDLQVLICLTSCAVLMFVVSFCLFLKTIQRCRKDCFSLAMPVVHLWQLQKLCDTREGFKVIFHFLQNMSWFCKNPTVISEHVIFLPSLCAADGLKDCVFILSQKSAKKTLFSAELKLKPGKKLAKHSLAS